VFGYWAQTLDVEEGAFYRFKVKFNCDGIDDINLNVFHVVLWSKSNDNEGFCNADYISNYHREQNLIIGEDTFRVPLGYDKAEIQLGLRFSSNGRVCWREIELEKTNPIRNRYLTRVIAAKYAPYLSSDQQSNLANLGAILDRAGESNGDILLLPEFSNRYHRDASVDQIAEEIPEGITCSLLREKAAKYEMYVCAGLYEKDGEFLFNTAAIFDRDGGYIGKYRKTHLHWLEEIDLGLSPGDEYPVFDLDFGRVGIIICYDGFFGEIPRVMALKGAELILHPNDGFERLLVPARAIDNRVYVAVSSIGRGDPEKWDMPAMIVDASGNILDETNEYGVVSSEIEISHRLPTLHIKRDTAGGTRCTSPGGRRGMRNSMSNRLYEEMASEIKNWEERSESFYMD
jgi:predicted amidohydrolase